MTGESDSMAGSGKSPGELDARVNHAGQTTRYSEYTSHSRSTVADWMNFSSLDFLVTAGVRFELSKHTTPTGQRKITHLQLAFGKQYFMR
jgi:hypothetical protein